MKRDLAALAGRDYDLLIVGGGIVGAGICWDAAQRGLSCALVEQGDFASGTSSKTTKLIHGGIRYLENLEIGLVREALRERGTLLRIAPHLVRPLPFLIPVAGRFPRPWPMVRAGVALYGWLAGPGQRREILSGERIGKAEPFLAESPFRHAAGYSDGQMDDAGMVLGALQAAARAGAALANHAAVAQWRIQEGRVSGAVVEDRLGGARHEIRARVVVNAGGPWVDRLRRLSDPSLRPLVRPSKGIHLLYPDLGLRHALVISSRKDGRIFFLIPWRGMTLIGTTDTDYDGDPGRARADAGDVDYLIREANAAVPQARLAKERVIATFAGIRPLAAQERRDPWAVSRMHLIHEDPNGLVSIVGGKFTTFRKIAEEVVDRIARRFPGRALAGCRTAQTPLGPDVERAASLSRWVQADPALGQPICPHHRFTWAEARYAVEQEMAASLSDLLWRRLQTGWSPCRGLDSLEEAGRRVGEWLGWDPGERARQIERYREEVEQTRRW